jgi:inhibitor of the pro-sigma K processing machinery
VAVYTSLIVGYLFVLFFLYVLGTGYYRPLLWIYKLLFRSGVGALVLYLFNAGTVIWQLNIPVNPYNSLLVGYLGGPGMLFLILAKYIIKI